MVSNRASMVGWSPPGCPFRIEFPAILIEEIRRTVVDAFYSVPRGGVEIGGALFGVAEQGCVRIAAWRPICCEYAFGPSFLLSEKDRSGLTKLLAEAQREPLLTGLKPMGWFHSHTRSDLAPRTTDLELYERFFGGWQEIALILHPAHLASTRGTFLFRDHEGMVKRVNNEEFTIDPAPVPAKTDPPSAQTFTDPPSVQTFLGPPLITPQAAPHADRRWGASLWLIAAFSAALAMGTGFAARSYLLPSALASVPVSPPLAHLPAPSSATNSAQDQIIEDLEKQVAEMRAELLDQRMRAKRLERTLAIVKKKLLREQSSLQ